MDGRDTDEREQSERRVASRRRDAGLRFGVRAALVGLFSLACSIFVVVRFLFSTPLALGLATAAALLCVVLWAVVPLLGGRAHPDGPDDT